MGIVVFVDAADEFGLLSSVLDPAPRSSAGGIQNSIVHAHLHFGLGGEQFLRARQDVGRIRGRVRLPARFDILWREICHIEQRGRIWRKRITQAGEMEFPAARIGFDHHDAGLIPERLNVIAPAIPLQQRMGQERADDYSSSRSHQTNSAIRLRFLFLQTECQASVQQCPARFEVRGVAVEFLEVGRVFAMNCFDGFLQEDAEIGGRFAADHRSQSHLRTSDDPDFQLADLQSVDVFGLLELEGIVDEILEADATLYNLKIPGDNPMGRGSYVDVDDVAERTGGEVVQVNSKDSLASTFSELIERIKTRYTLGYYSSVACAKSKEHKIDVSLAPSFGTKGEDYRVLARRGYYCSPKTQEGGGAQSRKFRRREGTPVRIRNRFLGRGDCVN